MIVTPTLLDKVEFTRWATRTFALSAIPAQTLEFLVLEILGRDNARPHNGWTTASYVARKIERSERSVQRAFTQLEGLRLLKRTLTVRGRGGRTWFHVPGIEGANGKLKDLAAAEAKRAHDASPDPVENTTSASHFCGRKYDTDVAENTTPMSYESFLITPSFGKQPSYGARGPAAEPPPAAAGQGFENDGGQEEGTLTRARARLLARLRGLAGKAGLTVGYTFLDHLGPDRVARWLRLQREDSPRASATLVREALELLSDYLAVDPSELAQAVATAPKAERKPKAKPASTSTSTPPPKPPPRPAAYGRPQRSHRPQAGEDDPLGIDRFTGARKDMHDTEALKASIARLNKLGPRLSNEDPSEEKRRAVAEYMARLGRPTPSGPKA